MSSTAVWLLLWFVRAAWVAFSLMVMNSWPGFLGALAGGVLLGMTVMVWIVTHGIMLASEQRRRSTDHF